ncbi:MAG: phosphatase PAP2 family protein [Bacteroidales bacterium]
MVVLLLQLVWPLQPLIGQVEVTKVSLPSRDSISGIKTPPPHLFRYMTRDLGQIWTAPLRAKPKDLLVWVPAIAGTVALIAYDKPVYGEIHDWEDHNPFVDRVDPYITFMGDEKFVAGIFAAFYISGEIFQDQRAMETAVLGWQTLFHTGLMAQVAKHIAGRQRPFITSGTEDIWHGPKGALIRYQPNHNIRSYNSFFSGHSIVAWGMASVIAGQYKDVKVVPYISYGLATLVSLSRITQDVHWSSDIFLGAFLGYQIGRYMVRHGCGKVRICPKPGPEGMQISFIYAL